MEMNSQAVANVIGANVRRYRDEHGLTQQEFAELIDISTSYCAQIETGRKIPSTLRLREMALRLGVPTDYFLFDPSKETDAMRIAMMMKDRPPKYVEFMERFVALCNDYLPDTPGTSDSEELEKK